MTTVLMADDSALLREGLVGLLERQGYEIVGQEHCADALLTTIAELAGRDALPDVVITDVRMPPTMTNDGLQAAIRIKEEHPRVAVLVLSQYVSPLHAQELFALPAPPGAGGAGYLLKDRVAQVADFIGALRMVVGGGVVIDPEVARAMMQASRSDWENSPRENSRCWNSWPRDSPTTRSQGGFSCPGLLWRNTFPISFPNSVSSPETRTAGCAPSSLS